MVYMSVGEEHGFDLVGIKGEWRPVDGIAVLALVHSAIYK
jgi:hypothetical protein